MTPATKVFNYKNPQFHCNIQKMGSTLKTSTPCLGLRKIGERWDEGEGSCAMGVGLIGDDDVGYEI